MIKNTKDFEMKAKSITNMFATNDFVYSEICDKCSSHHCYRYIINEDLYFEYWTPDEWEFSIKMLRDNPKHEAYYMVVLEMVKYMRSIRVTLSRIPSLIAICTAKVSEINKV